MEKMTLISLKYIHVVKKEIDLMIPRFGKVLKNFHDDLNASVT